MDSEERLKEAQKMLEDIALGLSFCYMKRGRDRFVMEYWSDLVTASKMYAIAFESNMINPIDDVAIPILAFACEFNEVSFEKVWDYISRNR